MKKIYLGIAIVLGCSSVQAQYKKASFLNKSGRTYDLGFSSHFLGGGRGSMPGIFYSYGRDQGKRTFHWFDLELLLPTKFSYTTFDTRNTEVSVAVTGKSKLGIAYRYNFGYYVTDPENAEAKVKPFVTAGINMLLAGGATGRIDSYTPEMTDPASLPSNSVFSCGANAGAGGVYSFTETIGLKFTAGYNFQTQMDPTSTSNEYKEYRIFRSHPYVTVGVRFLMAGDD